MTEIDLQKILKEEEQREMIALLNQHEDYNVQSLALGEINGRWFFGKQIEINKIKCDAVVLDDGTFLVNTKMQFKNIKDNASKIAGAVNAIEEYGFRTGKPLLTPENFWSKKGINGYITAKSNVVSVVSSPSQRTQEHYTNSLRASYTTTYTTLTTLTTLTTQQPKQEGLSNIKNIESLDNLIKEIQDYYMDVYDTTLTTLTTYYIIATYLYELFDSIGYLFLCSDSGTGKTKWSNIIQYMSFNSINATNTTESAMFRIVEQSKGTLFIDDYEKIEETKKNSIDQLLKVGYKKGGKTVRSEKVGDNFVPVFFDVYCPKVITNTEGMDSITYSRCIPLHLIKTVSTKGMLNPKQGDYFWQDVRDMCYFWAMLNWKEVKKNYKEINVDGLNNRDLELVKPVLAVAKTFGQDKYDTVLKTVLKIFENRDLYDFTNDWDYILFNSLRNYCSGENERFQPRVLQTKEICELMLADMHFEEDDKKRPTVKWVGRILSRIELFDKKRESAGVKYTLSLDKVEQYMRSRGWVKDEVVKTISL